MNISELISDIIDSEGLYSISLPYNTPPEVYVQKSIEKSIRTFSEFKRQKKETFVLVKDLKSPSETERMRNIFLLPTELTTTPIKDVTATCETYLADSKNITTNVFTVGSPFVGFGSYYPQDIINAQLTGTVINKFAGVTSRQPTVKYLGYNKIQLFDFPKDSCVHFIVECEHDLSGETIPESCRESFIQLATLDVQIKLYADLKNRTNVGSGYKDVQLKIDDWANAKSERKELVKQWTETYHLDETDAMMFF